MMEEEIRDAAILLRNIADKLEQDCTVLGNSLDGDIMDAYRRLIQHELDKVQDAQRLLLRVMESE